jgi:apolipoprotein D and lipocalin family protein
LTSRKVLKVNKNFFLLFLVFMTTVSASAQDRSEKPLEVVPSVDLERYCGVWYEIARLPNWFQKDCKGDVTASYTLLEDGEIKVVNRCRDQDGNMKEAEGRARRASDDGPSSKLKVRFAPAFLSFLSFVWGDYWIIDLAPDYSFAVVGEPNRKYLWVLARTPKLDDVTMQAILERVKEKGYDLRDLVRTVQNE